MTTDLFAALEHLAAERGETVSQLARRLLAEGIARQTDPDRDAIDAAIATLEAIRHNLGPADGPRGPRPRR